MVRYSFFNRPWLQSLSSLCCCVKVFWKANRFDLSALNNFYCCRSLWSFLLLCCMLFCVGSLFLLFVIFQVSYCLAVVNGHRKTIINLKKSRRVKNTYGNFVQVASSENHTLSDKALFSPSLLSFFFSVSVTLLKSGGRCSQCEGSAGRKLSVKVEKKRKTRSCGLCNSRRRPNNPSSPLSL